MAKDVSASELQEMIKTSEIPIIVDFWAPWCGPCRAQGPILDKWVAEHEGQAEVVKINVDENGDLATNLGITSIPTIMVYAGGEEKARGIGVQDATSINDMLAKS